MNDKGKFDHHEFTADSSGWALRGDADGAYFFGAGGVDKEESSILSDFGWNFQPLDGISGGGGGGGVGVGAFDLIHADLAGNGCVSGSGGADESPSGDGEAAATQAEPATSSSSEEAAAAEKPSSSAASRPPPPPADTT